MKLGLENFHFAGGFSVISKILLGGVFTLLLPQVLSAEQIRGPESIEFFDRAMRFFEMRDHSVRVVALGSVLIGISCGMMGSYVVTRKLSLFGDTLSHAVLPGIAIGFLWAESKDNLALLLGASFAGFLGVACISLLKKFTKISQDSALGIVLSGFYAVGICMLTRIQKMDFGNQSGLDTYLFGQVSALSTNDLIGVCA
ncbi:MAG: metal ABC transporter permease, partial [Verrucomicrobiota bacterium]|nr:metal ABC transporter permease [Verrucomicrobiota bacterium]